MEKKKHKFKFQETLGKYDSLPDAVIEDVLRREGPLRSYEVAVLEAFREIEKGEARDVLPGFSEGYRVLKQAYRYSESNIINAVSVMRVSGYLEMVEKKDRFNILKLSGKGKSALMGIISKLDNHLEEQKKPKESVNLMPLDHARAYMKELKNQIDEVVRLYPAKNSICIDYQHLEKWALLRDSTLADQFRINPDAALEVFEKAIAELDVIVGIGSDKELRFSPQIRLSNFPHDSYGTTIDKIDTEHEAHMISFEGTVVGKTQKYGKVRKAAFRCARCKSILEVPQKLFNEAVEIPIRCPECTKRGPFIHLDGRESEKVLFQMIHVQQKIDSLEPGKQADNVAVCCTGDIVGMSEIGNKVRVTGILRYLLPRQRGYMPSKRLPIVEALFVERMDMGIDVQKFTPEEIKQFKKFSKEPDLYKKITDSIAPSIYGYDNIKMALALQLFGGRPNKVNKAGGHVRSDPHILLIGDPSTAKSEMIGYAAELSSKFIVTSGKGSSGCGLTATVGKDPIDKDRWILKPGALPLANGGILAVDEFDKMDPDDRDYMLQGMEQQKISITKADIAAELRCQTTVLAAANPMFSRWDEYKPLAEQIALSDALLSRFDLVFPVFDVVDQERDSKIAKAVIANHSFIPGQTPNGSMDRTFLRKYIAYAKKTINPILTKEIGELLDKKYVLFRQRSKKAKAITPRQIGGLIRLSEARAKMRLCDEVTVEDVNVVFDIYTDTMKELALDQATGEIDVDKLFSTHTSHDRQNRRMIENIVRELCGPSLAGSANIQTILARSAEKGIEETEARKILGELKSKGVIYESKHNYYKVNE